MPQPHHCTTSTTDYAAITPLYYAQPEDAVLPRIPKQSLSIDMQNGVFEERVTQRARPIEPSCAML